MEMLTQKGLELIGTALVLGILAVFLIAIIRPEQLPIIIGLVKSLVNSILRRDENRENRTRRKDDDEPDIK